MDINTAEQNLTRRVARVSGLELDRQVLRGALPGGAPGVRVRFVSGHTGNAALSEFVAEIVGVFAEPDEARAFAAAVWGGLPAYFADGFSALVGEDGVVFSEERGWFTVTGRIHAVFG